MSAAPDRAITYRPGGPILRSFHKSESFVRGIRGPIGSGKSTACVMEILRRSSMQLHSPDGKRRTRWAIVRNSYPELRTTTLKTWGEWCPPQYGRLTMDSPIRHHVTAQDMDMEVFFLALDRDEDVRKLLSLELTGAWFNEAREIPKALVDAMTGRVGRYPAIASGGATWSGILMDTNPPDDQSWWYRLAEEETPEGWEFFSQPSGLSSEAENTANLPEGYYKRLLAGKDPEWVTVYVHGDYGFLIEGKPVFPMYRDRIHCSPTVIPIHPGLPILMGADFGLTPAAIFGQLLVDGRWQIIDELTADGCGVTRFAQTLNKYVAENYPDHAEIYDEELKKRLKLPSANEPCAGWGDPAGADRGQNDEKTALDIMNEHTNWKWRPAPTNVFTMRREVVVAALNRMVDGNPGILISPKCLKLRKGFNSGYHFKLIQTGGGSPVTHETPVKNEFSHPHDGLQYLLLGGGEAGVVMNRDTRRRRRGGPPRVARDVDYDPLNYRNPRE